MKISAPNAARCSVDPTGAHSADASYDRRDEIDVEINVEINAAIQLAPGAFDRNDRFTRVEASGECRSAPAACREPRVRQPPSPNSRPCSVEQPTLCPKKLEEENPELMHKLRKIQAKIDDDGLRKRIDELKQRLDGLKDKVRGLDAAAKGLAVAAFKSPKSAAEGAAVASEASSLRAEIPRLEKELEDLHKLLAKQKQRAVMASVGA